MNTDSFVSNEQFIRDMVARLKGLDPGTAPLPEKDSWHGMSFPFWGIPIELWTKLDTCDADHVRRVKLFISVVVDRQIDSFGVQKIFPRKLRIPKESDFSEREFCGELGVFLSSNSHGFWLELEAHAGLHNPIVLSEVYRTLDMILPRITLDYTD